MNASMTLDGPKSLERGADDKNFEVRFRALRNTVHVALVFHHEVRGFEPFGELVLNSFLASHRASLPRPPFMRERRSRVREGTAVSFAFRAIQRRA